MAELDFEEKKRVRDMAAEWLAAEERWRGHFCVRLVLAVVVYPVYVVYGLITSTFIVLLTLVAILFSLLLCFLVCFRLDGVFRKCLWCICGKPKAAREAEEAAKRGDDNAAQPADVEQGGAAAIKENGEIEGQVKDQLSGTNAGSFMGKLLKAVLWGRLVLASPGRFLISRRLKKIEDTTSKVLLERSSYTYLIPKDTVLQLTSWPKHEEALAKGLLVRVNLDQLTPPQTGARILNPVLFVSHKWIGNSPDNEQNEVLEKVKERINTTPKNYVWFDYACVPQDDAVERMLHLRSIPEILSRCEIGAILHNELALADSYVHSIWCQLEFIMSGLDMKKLSEQRQWTIYDPNDLYLILPSFLNMTCKPQNFYEMFGGVRRLGGHVLLAQILRFFVDWHDKSHGMA